MKTSAIALLVIFMSIIFVLNLTPVSAFDQSDVSMSTNWSAIHLYQGDTVSVNLILTNNSPETLTIYTIGIHFDWMTEEDGFQGRNLSDNPVTVESAKVHVFEPMTITIPEEVSVGYHNYTLAIDCAEGEDPPISSWTSQPKQMIIQHAKAKVFRALVDNITSIIDENTTYQSAEAQTLFDQANSEYSQAVFLSYDDQWDDAIVHMQNAVSYAEQAEEAEQRNTTQNADLQRLLLIIAPIATVVIISVIVILIWHRRTKPDSEDDQTTETQDYTPEE